MFDVYVLFDRIVLWKNKESLLKIKWFLIKCVIPPSLLVVHFFFLIFMSFGRQRLVCQRTNTYSFVCMYVLYVLQSNFYYRTRMHAE
jgi:hypothetical protein